MLLSPQHHQEINEDYQYRENVGIMLVNDEYQILAGEACYYPGEWLMPQGGIQRGETPEQAMWRELLEETGIDRGQTELLGSYPDWLYYQLRKPLTEKNRIYTGQKQKWFLVRYNGPVPDANNIVDQEFLQFDRVSPNWLLQKAAHVKTHVYQQLFDYFL